MASFSLSDNAFARIFKIIKYQNQQIRSGEVLLSEYSNFYKKLAVYCAGKDYPLVCKQLDLIITTKDHFLKNIKKLRQLGNEDNLDMREILVANILLCEETIQAANITIHGLLEANLKQYELYSRWTKVALGSCSVLWTAGALTLTVGPAAGIMSSIVKSATLISGIGTIASATCTVGLQTILNEWHLLEDMCVAIENLVENEKKNATIVQPYEH